MKCKSDNCELQRNTNIYDNVHTDYCAECSKKHNFVWYKKYYKSRLYTCLYEENNIICNADLIGKQGYEYHLSYVHDIGDEQCDICIQNVFKLNKYHDKKIKTDQNICHKCYNKVTGKNTRIEKEWSEHTDKHLGTEYLSSSDKSLKSIGGCQLYRPDKLYIGINMVEVDECDEHQHNHKYFGNNSYTCDEKRISDIYEEDGICGKIMPVIRWNPDTYKEPNGNKKKTKKERLELFVKLKKHLRKNPPKDKIHIYYMFYDEDNPLIAKNIPFTMIYEESDFIK